MLAPLSTTFDRVVDWVLIPSQRSDPLARARARVGCAAILLFGAVAAIRAMSLFWFGVPSQATLLIVCAALAFGMPAVARYSRSFALAAHGGVGLLMLALVGGAYASGGASSPALAAFVIVPQLALFLTGRRGGGVWFALVVFVIVAFALLARLGWSPPIRFPFESWTIATATAAFLLVVVGYVLSTAHERARAQAFEAYLTKVRELDEAVRREREAHESHERELGWLTSSLSHEANNTLAYIQADLDYIHVTLQAKDPELSSALDEARGGTTRLGEIVRDLRTISLEADEDDPSSVADADLVLREAVAIARAAGMQITIEETGELSRVRVGPATLERALLNLLMASGPEARLTVALQSGGVILVTARGGATPRELAIAAARRLLHQAGAGLSIQPHADGWTMGVMLPIPRA